MIWTIIDLVNTYCLPLYIRVRASTTVQNLCQPVDSYSGGGSIGILWHTHT